MKRILTISRRAGLALLLSMLGATAALATCGPADVARDRLARGYGEELMASGLSGGGVLFEFWADPASGSWTILMVRPDGVACIGASGGDLELGLSPARPEGMPL